ncbi:MAG TPA: hypothetical protein VNL77_23815 [Roseiflexaceae bacterium]|nr:hypothetical protein [Roseiflexaceae bacterium]
MRGRLYSTTQALPERDLHELSDLLALQLYQRLGSRAFDLSRRDIAELIEPYTDDLLRDDRRAVAWLVWELLQEGADIALEAA